MLRHIMVATKVKRDMHPAMVTFKLQIYRTATSTPKSMKRLQGENEAIQ